MSGLRFMADFMHEQIALETRLKKLETRLKKIEANAAEYARRCKAERAAALPVRTDRPPPSFFAASEGLCAANIIMRTEP